MAEKKISDLTNKENVNNDDEFVFVDKTTTSGSDASTTGQTSKIKFSDLKNAVGSQGQKGATGEKGAPGAKGAPSTIKGDKGAPGAKGAPSTIKGDKGATGEKGAPGQKGAASTVKGDKGAPGAKGAPSTVKGDKGAPGEKGVKGGAGTNALDSSGNLVINNSNLEDISWDTTTFPNMVDHTAKLGTADETGGQNTLVWIGPDSDGYTEMWNYNISATAKGSQVATFANRRKDGSASNANTPELYLGGALQVQTLWDGSKYNPRMALTYQNFQHQSMDHGQEGKIWHGVTNLFINGGHLRAYSNFNHPNHVTSNGEIELGSASNRWKEIFAVQDTINTSDVREKTDILEIEEAEKNVARKAKALLKKYRWKESKDNKDDNARIHFGIVAQDLIEAFKSEGLDPFKYAVVCHNVWYKNPEDASDTREEETEGFTKHDRYGVRYNQLLAFIISAL